LVNDYQDSSEYEIPKNYFPIPKKTDESIKWFDGSSKLDYLKKIITNQTSIKTENYDNILPTGKPKPGSVDRKNSLNYNIVTN
jgi:hypothetical protein